MLLSLLTLTNIMGADSQTPGSRTGGKRSTPNAKDEPSLELAATIVGMKSSIAQYSGFVRGKPVTFDATWLQLTIKLNFVNTGNQSILLYKKSDLIGDYGISRDLQAALSERYEVKIRTDYAFINAPAGGFRDDEPQPDEFVVLKPGNSYSAERSYKVRPYDGNWRKLKAGKHYLQVWVLTWYYDRHQAEAYREKWHDKGYLWSDILIPKPILFAIEK